MAVPSLTVAAAVLSTTLVARPTTARARPPESEADRALARQCLALTGDSGIEACRRALAGSLSRERAAVVRRALEARLISLQRFDDLVEIRLEAVRADPRDPLAQLRLGSALLFLAGRPPDAVAPLREAVRLDPVVAEAHGTLAMALAALGQLEEATSELKEAVRLDPEYLESRPASAQVLEAAGSGRVWP
jgi:tetratricopeptide (TPR) repeat protein